MPCDTPFDAFRISTESLPQDIHKRATWRSPWLNFIPRGTYPKGTGLVQSTFTLGRSEPTSDEPDFETISLATGNDYTGSCNTTYHDVPVGFVEDTYSPEKIGWKGPVVCSDDLIFNFKAEAFLTGYVAAITKHTERTISNRLQSIYTHLVPKAVARDDFGFVAGATGGAPQSPDLTLGEAECELSQEMLDATAAELNEEGASDGDTDGWIQLGEDGPVYTLLIGQEMSHRILKLNANLRQDYREAFNGSGEMHPLLKRMGASKVIGNFRHLINLFPPRYTYAGGAYTRVPTWLMQAGTKGTVAKLNPAWKAAPYEGCHIINPLVFTDEIIQPVNAAAGMSWTPKNYMGVWDFITGGDKISTTKCFDPLGKLGAHFAEFHHAAKPVFPEFGRFIIFKRCPQANFTCFTCPPEAAGT
jgi:hypothetical protein